MRMKKILLVVVAIFILVLGVVLGITYKKHTEENNLEYEKAMLTTDLSNIGYNKHIFAEGTISTSNPVSFEEVGGEYIYMEKVFYKKKMTTQTYTSNGKTKTRRVRKWRKQGEAETKWTDSITFCNKEYKTSEFELPSANYITEIKTGTYEKYKYNGISNNIKGTLYIHMNENGEIVEERFYEGVTSKELQERYMNNSSFGMVVIILIAIGLSGFCLYIAYNENEYY